MRHTDILEKVLQGLIFIHLLGYYRGMPDRGELLRGVQCDELDLRPTMLATSPMGPLFPWPASGAGVVMNPSLSKLAAFPG